MSAEGVKDKNGETIYEDDFVFTRYRGGSHQGKVNSTLFLLSAVLSDLDVLDSQVEKIVMDAAGAREEGVANPPKVCYSCILCIVRSGF